MTALQEILKYAKDLKKKHPNKVWANCIKEAGAIYRSKHKVKLVKKTAKKKAVKKVGKINTRLKKDLKGKGLKLTHGYDTVKRKRISGVKKKPTESAVLKSIKKAEKVQKAHMGGVSKIAIKKYQNLVNEIEIIEKHINKLNILHKNSHDSANKKNHKLNIAKYKKLLSELKTHSKELKKHI